MDSRREANQTVCDFFVDSVLVARFYQTNEFENINVNEDVTFEEGREGFGLT